MNDLRGKIDQARRDMANAAWCAGNEHTCIDVVLVWAQTIVALYAQLDTPHDAPKPDGLVLAGRTRDGSYIFSKSGTTKRKTSQRDFASGYYRRDSEFPNVEVVQVVRANVSNDLIFSGVQA